MDLLRHWRLRRIQVLEAHVRKVPEDVRARVMLANDYASLDRVDDALHTAEARAGRGPDGGKDEWIADGDGGHFGGSLLK